MLTIKDRDYGAQKREKALHDAGRGEPEVTVGIHASEGAAGYPDTEATVLDVAVWNEFGTSRIPPRSFIRDWYDEAKDEAHEMLTHLMHRVAEGHLDRQKALDQFGLWCVGQIQARIAAGIPPANAPSTIVRKGSSKPLIDTGQLRTSITHVVQS